MENNLLRINDLCVNAEDKEILKGINLKINKGEMVYLRDNCSKQTQY